MLKKRSIKLKALLLKAISIYKITVYGQPHSTKTHLSMVPTFGYMKLSISARILQSEKMKINRGEDKVLEFSKNRNQMIIMAGGIASIVGLAKFGMEIVGAGNFFGAIAAGCLSFALAFIASFPLVAFFWKLTAKGALAAGSVFFGSRRSHAAIRGYSQERGMARQGRIGEAFE